MKQLKSVKTLPKKKMDTWEVSYFLYGKAAVEEDHCLTERAVKQLKKAGWTLTGEYNELDQELWQPPKGGVGENNV